MGKREKVEETKFVRMCDEHGFPCPKMGGTGFYGTNGYNDRLPVLPGGKVIWFEFKREGGDTNKKTYAGKLQRWRHKQLKRLGHKSYVVYTAKEAWGILTEEVGTKKVSDGIDSLRPKAKRRRIFSSAGAR